MTARERQTASELAGIRADHVARYRWAAGRLGGGSVLDAGCGVGYGAAILADAGCSPVLAMDRSGEALAAAVLSWDREVVTWMTGDLEHADLAGLLPPLDAVVAFEVVEHLRGPAYFLQQARALAPRLLLSVPNQDVVPYSRARFRYHERHYTREQLADLLSDAGWTITGWYGQRGKYSRVEPEVRGRTIVVEAV